MPPSSDPCAIYKDLAVAIANSDSHNAKITQQRASLMALAVDFATKNTISEEDRDTIIAMVQRAPLMDFTPHLYVIPCQAVAARAQFVPPDRRAGSEPEWIIPDLRRDEFDILEF